MDNHILSKLIITDVRSVHTLFTNVHAKNTRTNRPCWAITLKFEGETIYTCQGKRYISDASHVVVLPKGYDYEWVCTKKGHFCTLEFDADIACDEIFSFDIADSSKILKIYRRLEHQRLVKHPFYKMDSIRGTYEILLALLSRSGVNYNLSSKYHKIKPAVDYITKYYDTDIKNDELAALANISTVYFRKIFTEVFGISPISYLHKIRIEKAKDMLRGDYGKVSDIAEALGYSNIYHFSKTFKAHTGISPVQYASLSDNITSI